MTSLSSYLSTERVRRRWFLGGELPRRYQEEEPASRSVPERVEIKKRVKNVSLGRRGEERVEELD